LYYAGNASGRDNFIEHSAILRDRFHQCRSCGSVTRSAQGDVRNAEILHLSDALQPGLWFGERRIDANLNAD
jgi:hypothetical protein